MSRANDMIRRMPHAFDAHAAGDLRMTVQYLIEQPMFIVIDAGECSVHDGLADVPDVTLKIRGEHLVKLMNGGMYGITAYLTGKLKIEGNLMLAQRLQQIFDRERLV